MDGAPCDRRRRAQRAPAAAGVRRTARAASVRPSGAAGAEHERGEQPPASPDVLRGAGRTCSIPYGTNFISGIERQMDVRSARINPVTGQLVAPSVQVAQYAVKANSSPVALAETAPGYDAVSRAQPWMYGGGTKASSATIRTLRRRRCSSSIPERGGSGRPTPPRGWPSGRTIATCSSRSTGSRGLERLHGD